MKGLFVVMGVRDFLRERRSRFSDQEAMAQAIEAAGRELFPTYTLSQSGLSRWLLDCVCTGQVPFCAPCLLAMVIHMRIQHPNTLSVAMIRRRIPGIDGRTAWILLEATKLVA